MGWAFSERLGMGSTHQIKEKELNMCDLFRSKTRSHNELINSLCVYLIATSIGFEMKMLLLSKYFVFK